MNVFWSAFGLTFLSEIPDKSRLVALALTGAFRAPAPVFAGMTLAFALLEGAAVLAGSLAHGRVAPAWMQPAVGGLFVLIGAGLLVFPGTGAGGLPPWTRRFEKAGPFLVSFAAIALSELADRTQIVAAALAAESGRPWPVFSGGLLALALLNALTVLFGARLVERVPAAVVRRAGALLFIVSGLWMLARAWRAA